jgi:hypothetical protein
LISPYGVFSVSSFYKKIIHEDSARSKQKADFSCLKIFLAIELTLYLTFGRPCTGARSNIESEFDFALVLWNTIARESRSGNPLLSLHNIYYATFTLTSRRKFYLDIDFVDFSSGEAARKAL